MIIKSKTRIFQVVMAVLMLCMAFQMLPVTVSAEANSSSDNSIRAIWVRPKENSKEAVEATVQRIADAGLNTIFLETVYDGYSIYPIEHECVVQNEMYGGFDVLQAYIDACHARNMELHCWTESFFVGMEWSHNGGPIVAAHPDWLLEDNNGNAYEETMYGKMYFLNPVRPECREFLIELFADLVENYDIDGFQMDYVRYPEKKAGLDWGYDGYTRKAFMDAYGADLAELNSVTEKTFVLFKQAAVTAYVEECSKRLKEIRPELTISLSVTPWYENAESTYMQSARLWMSSGYADLLVPMCYYENQVADHTQEALDAVDGDVSKVVIGLSAQSGFTTESLENQVKEVRKTGSGVSLFEYESFFAGGYAEVLREKVFAQEEVLPAESSSGALPVWAIGVIAVAGAALLVVLVMCMVRKSKPLDKGKKEMQK